MTPANEFTQPIDKIGGTYGQITWPGYEHKQVRTEGGRHIGDDYNGPGGGNTDLGYDVLSVANGVIEKIIPWSGKYGYGNHVFVRHELAPYLQKKYNCPVIYSHYAHLDAFRCKEGQQVTKGQVIAKLGNSGTKYAHLHLEIRRPTGKGYESYPSNESVAWIDKYYFTPYLFIEENKKEPEQAPTTTPQDTPSNETADISPENPPTGSPEPNGTVVPGDSLPDTTTPATPADSVDVDSNISPQSEETPETVPQPAPVQPISVKSLLKRLSDVWKAIISFIIRH